MQSTDPLGTLNICRAEASPSGHKAVTTFAAVAVIILPEAYCGFIFIAPKRLPCRILFGFPQRATTAQDAHRERVNGPHVEAHGKRTAGTPGGFPHSDGEGDEKRRSGGGEDRARFTGRPQVSVVRGQKVVLAPAVSSSAMCRMWVIFKEAEALGFDAKHQQLPRYGELKLQLEK
ncbi:hypothetical protein EYF80_028185 [Liparis tanakae]|uniref:Uncharacterized protein n=1 Tax=Liparis tanakae TaxID=230148 RepID=A0A4Z2H950_9TELE|nr:hypothetical protein EYF80_028185 [Liparis tanakae]